MFQQNLYSKTISKLKNNQLKKIRKSSFLFDKPCFYCLTDIQYQIDDLTLIKETLKQFYFINSTVLNSRIKNLTNLYKKLFRRHLAFDFAIYLVQTDCLPF